MRISVRWSRLAMIVSLLSMVGVTAALADRPGGDQAGPSRELLGPDNPNWAQANEDASKAAERRNTPTAREERRSSRTAYHGLSRSAARDLARQKFHDAVESRPLDGHEPSPGLIAI